MSRYHKESWKSVRSPWIACWWRIVSASRVNSPFQSQLLGPPPTTPRRVLSSCKMKNSRMPSCCLKSLKLSSSHVVIVPRSSRVANLRRSRIRPSARLCSVRPSSSNHLSRPLDANSSRGTLTEPRKSSTFADVAVARADWAICLK